MSSIDTDVKAPILLAPTALNRLGRSDGEVATARTESFHTELELAMRLRCLRTADIDRSLIAPR